MNKEELLKGLTPEQIKKARECKTVEELLNVAKAESLELTDEQLAAVAGGGCFETKPVACPVCGHGDLSVLGTKNSGSQTDYECLNCGHTFTI